MVQEERPQRAVMAGFCHTTSLAAFHYRYRPAPGTAVQGQPASALGQPGIQRGQVVAVGIGACGVGHQQLAHRQPAVQIGEIVRNGNVFAGVLGQQVQQTPAHRVHVMAGMLAGRIATNDEMDGHGRTLVPGGGHRGPRSEQVRPGRGRHRLGGPGGHPPVPRAALGRCIPSSRGG